MLKVLVFSHNRAAQCDATLSSFFSRFQTHIPLSVSVIYTATDETFERGYSQLRIKYAGRSVEFRSAHHPPSQHRKSFWGLDNLARILSSNQERDNDNNFKRLTEQALESKDIEYVLFLSDECVFYKQLIITPEILNLIAKGAESTAFHTRLGLNVQQKPINLRDQTRYCQWYADKSAWHWSERFSILGSLYNAASMRLFLQPLQYNNIKSLQQCGSERALKLDAWNNQYCFHVQRLVELSIDDVHVASPRELNEQFIHGNSLRVSINGYINDVSINTKKVVFDYDPERILSQAPAEPDFGYHSGSGQYQFVQPKTFAHS